MTIAFDAFNKLVAASFQSICKSVPYEVALTGDDLWAAYLAAFPEGADPKTAKASEHTCSTCRHFVKHAGAVVGVKNGEKFTVWDEAAKRAEYPYNVVAHTLREKVLASDIADLFIVGQKETQFGAPVTRVMGAGGQVINWTHLHTGEVPPTLRRDDVGSTKSEARSVVQVFERGLKELSPNTIDTVLSLIEGGLYRGTEHKQAVLGFQKLQKAYSELPEGQRQAFIWSQAGHPASRFRNTVIGTLAVDIADGTPIEDAARMFESKVAPANYKRTTALITPKMIENAMKTIAELDIEPALERRFARIADISVNDVLWVDGTARPLMKGGLADVLMQTVKPSGSAPDEKDAEAIGIDAFLKDVLPRVTSMEVYFKNEHQGNLMSLTAPVHSEPRQLFRWTNDFAWSYNGNIADSVKERVKKAGGQVDGVLRVSLSWFNYDDLDLHLLEPGARVGDCGHIYYANKFGATGARLDVDMNAGSGKTREAVENIAWPNSVPNGVYAVLVRNYCRRELIDTGFVVEIEGLGQKLSLRYPKALPHEHAIDVAKLHVSNGSMRVVVEPGFTAQSTSQEKWGIHTEQFVKVNTVTLSPNYWGENATGNKHFFFVLDGAKNDEPTRGIYNEFLHPRLEPHRKVFEIIGEKTKCQPTEGQLSGLGFSSTKLDTLLVRAQQGRAQKLYAVYFGV